MAVNLASVPYPPPAGLGPSHLATTQHDWESWPTGRLGPFVSDARMKDAMHCFQSFDRQRTDWSRTEEQVFYITEFSRSGRGQFHRLSQVDLNKHFRLELFVGHVTEPQLDYILKVSIESLWLFTSHLLSGFTSRCWFQIIVSDVVLRRRSVLISSSFASSQKGRNAIYSTYTRDILSTCGAPAAVWAAFLQESTSSFDSFTDTRNANTTFREWFLASML